MSEPAPPTDVVIRYRNGTKVVPDSVDYFGYDTERELHIWVATLPRPLTPGVALVEVAVMPPHSEVICR